jgi:S1-C subfamily serine protease
MYIFNHRLFPVLGLLSFFVFSNFGQAQNFYALKATVILCSVKIETASQMGSGVLLEDGATIATCAHVVGDSEWVSVETESFSGRAYCVAKDRDKDIAILRLNKRGQPFAVKERQSREEMGAFTLAAGRRMGHKGVDIQAGYTRGYVSGYESNFIISTVPKPGHSGGPVVNQDGQLIGIIQSFAGIEGDVATAVIPISTVLEVIKEAREKL